MGPGERRKLDGDGINRSNGTRENAALEVLLEHIESKNDGLDKEKDDEALFNFRDRLRVIIHGEVSDSTMF